MKFDMQTPLGPTPAGPAGGDGRFDVTPSVIASVVTDIDTEAQKYNSLATALETAVSGICEASKAWPVAEEMAGIHTYVFQRYMRIIGARTVNNLTAVTNVVTILVSADVDMSDTARASAARAAQSVIDDDPLADPNAPVRVGSGPGAVQ